MKKWLTFLLLLVTITTTTFYPCCSDDDCVNDKLTTQTPDHDSEKSKGNCSPFITCGSCTGFTQIATVAEVPFIAAVKPVHHSKTFSLTLSAYTASLLQPPQVA